MDTTVDNRLVQTFTEGNVTLNITSFKDMKFWNEMRDIYNLKNIWDFASWLMPQALYNIHNYIVIKDRFVKTPNNNRIFDLLKDNPRYRAVITVNLHNPFKGCHVRLGSNDLDMAIPYRPDTFLMRRGDSQYAIQDYCDPNKDKSISLLTQFSFYEIFTKYVTMANANNGTRTFVMMYDDVLVTDKRSIGFDRSIKWYGIAFENTIPVRDRSRSLYHRVGDLRKSVEDDKSFYNSFKNFAALIDSYVMGANNNDSRVGYAVSYVPIPYTDADYLMREVRARVSRLKLIDSDFDVTFTPYLEIGNNPYDFTFGVVSR